MSSSVSAFAARGRPPALLRWALVAAGLLAVAGCAGRQAVPEPPAPAEIPTLEERVEANPEAVEPRVRLGAAYRADGRLEQARRVLEEARRLDPDDARTALLLGLTYEDLERYGDARQVYESYLSSADRPDLAGRVEARLAYLDRRELEASIRQTLQREEELADRPPSENTVAVFPYLYQGASPEFRPLSRAMAEFLVTDLARSDRITVLERTRVQLLLQEMELSESRYVDPATAVRSGRLLGASRVVQGVMSGSEESLRVETSMVDAGGEPTDEAPPPIFDGERSAEDILELEAEIAFSVFDRMGIELTPAERRAIRDRPTENLQALVSFGRGLMAEDTADFAGAAAQFRQAAEIDPGFEAASERAEAASDLTAASGQSTDELAQAAFGEDQAAEEVETASSELMDETIGGEDVGLDRDPAAEVLGVEGVSGGSAILRILIPPPGGGLR